MELSKFSSDLLEGQKLEDFILWKIQKKYPKATKSEGSFKDYDIDVPELAQKFECKWDKKSQVTENIAIEFMDRGKPSGLNVTTATHWIYLFYDNGWKFAFLEIGVIHYLCKNARIVKGGDGWQAEMYLLPKRLLYKQDGVIIKKFTKELKEFRKLHAG